MPSQNLREALRAFLTDWRKDVPAAWQNLLADTEPDFAGVKAELTLEEDKPIFPGRKNHPVNGSPPGAHVFRALSVLTPDKVKAVIIGQDPYPAIARATGRSFDQGDLNSWTDPAAEVAPSLRPLAQIAAHFRTGNDAYLKPGTGWNRLVADLTANTLTLEPPTKLFDHWENQGVLCLNAALTISGYKRGGSDEQKFGHLPLWRPVINRIILALAARNQGHVVFLAWGSFARNLLTESGVLASPRFGQQVFVTEKRHPSVDEFLDPPNAFAEANSLLTQHGATPIAW